MDEGRGIGDRIREVRKRRGLTQRELSARSRVSVSVIRHLEQGIYGGVRLETAHRLAVVLRVPTSALVAGPDAAEPDRERVGDWEPVRRALEGTLGGEPAGEPTLDGLREGVRGAVSAVLDSRYSELRVILPALLRDADALVSVSVNGEESQARQARSQIRQVAAYMMGQTWQFAVAGDAIDLALDDADEKFTAMAAADWKCWLLLRQGRLAECGELAARWADDAEPRVSRATADELAAWGRFLVQVSSAAVRDNRPGEARDSLRLARMAASGIGPDVSLSSSPWQEFGQATVARVAAENATIQDRPDVTLSISSQITPGSFRVLRNWNRNRLDVAHAHVAMRQYPEAVGVIQGVRRAAPEWLVQQRYAGEILRTVIERRRSLTAEMRELSDFVGLSL